MHVNDQFVNKRINKQNWHQMHTRKMIYNRYIRYITEIKKEKKEKCNQNWIMTEKKYFIRILTIAKHILKSTVKRQRNDGLIINE